MLFDTIVGGAVVVPVVVAVAVAVAAVALMHMGVGGHCDLALGKQLIIADILKTFMSMLELKP